MKNALLIILTTCAAAVFLPSCSSSVSTDGGTGTETVNTFALRPDGTPAAGAVARIVDAGGWFDSVKQGVSPVILEAVADKRGCIKLSVPKQTRLFNLQIDHGSGACLIRFTALMSEMPDTIRLQPQASYSGSFDSSASPPSRVLLSGTSYEAQVDETGAFFFSSVAPGSYAVLCINDRLPKPVLSDGIALTLESGKTFSEQRITADAERLLIDNFESGIGPTALGRILPVLGWYVLSDSLYYYWNIDRMEWTKGVSSVIGHSPIYFDSVSTAPDGKAFSFSTVLDTVSPFANSLIGISLKPLSSKGLDLSTMKSFSVRASGNGTIGVRFESAGLDSVTSMLYHYAYPLKLSKNSQQYTIPVDSLRIMGPAEPVMYSPVRYPWKNESKRVLRIEFEFSPSLNKRGDSLYCVLDDFFLNGVSVESVLSNSKK